MTKPDWLEFLDGDIQCPYCYGISFNFIKRRSVERAGLTWKKGKLAPVGGDPKNEVRLAVCRDCHEEFDEVDFKDAEKGEFCFSNRFIRDGTFK